VSFRGLLLSFIFLWLAPVRADLVIVQHVDGSGQSGDQTIRIKGDKARTDLAQQLSMITDGATGNVVTLMHSQKTFLKVSAEQTKAMMEQMQKLRPAGDPPKLVPTGKTEKIGAFDCEIFTTNFGGVAVTYYVAKGFPNYPAILAQMEKLQAGSISAMTKGMMPELKEFPGMQMKTEMELGGKKVITVLVSAKEENVDPAVFEIPKDYKEVTAPGLDFQKK
jgi:nitrogen regulatory protein PII